MTPLSSSNTKIAAPRVNCLNNASPKRNRSRALVRAAAPAEIAI
jgi:hypothetical protein